jgi:hypothetical protein
VSLVCLETRVMFDFQTSALTEARSRAPPGGRPRVRSSYLLPTSFNPTTLFSRSEQTLFAIIRLSSEHLQSCYTVKLLSSPPHRSRRRIPGLLRIAQSCSGILQLKPDPRPWVGGFVQNVIDRTLRFDKVEDAHTTNRRCSQDQCDAIFRGGRQSCKSALASVMAAPRFSTGLSLLLHLFGGLPFANVLGGACWLLPRTLTILP